MMGNITMYWQTGIRHSLMTNWRWQFGAAPLYNWRWPLT